MTTGASEPVIFGTDGWRGVIADTFTFSNLRRAATAAARAFKQHRIENPVLIGYDRRFLSPEFARVAAACFLAEGIPVRLGRRPLTTPALSVCVQSLRAPWGIMITASHNPALYNGFKIKDAAGRSASSETTRAVEACLPDHLDAESALKEIPGFEPLPAYERYLKKHLDLQTIRKFSACVILDHLFGVASGIPEALLKGGRTRIESLHAAHDPLFGGLHPEPIAENLAPLQNEVRKRRAAIGLAFDGDADRLGVVADGGAYLTPHQVFPLLALYAVEYKKLPGKIVQSVSLGVLGERIAQALGRPFQEVPVGFKYIAERMLAESVAAGGEESGGYALGGGLPERDGILCGLLLLEMLAVRGQKLSALVTDMEKRFGRSRFKRIDIHLKKALPSKEDFVKNVLSRLPDRLLDSSVKETRTRDGLKVVLDSGAWVLLRPSGTEPLLRTYAETDSPAKTSALLTQARDWANAVSGEFFA